MSDGYASIPSVLEGSWTSARPTGAFARTVAAWILLIAVTFGQRFCIPLGTFQISLVVPLAYLALYFLSASGHVRINTVGLLLYAATVALMIVTLYIGKINFSPFSVIYLFVLYFAYVFSVDVPREEYLGYLEIFQKLLVILAAIALVQWAGEIISAPRFSLFDYLPQDFWLVGYNTRPTLGYESSFHKANAEFFLEPSFLSQYMALGIIIEILYFGKWWRIALYGLAIFASFSGTGMLLLALFSVLCIVKAKRYELLALMPILLAVYFAFQDNPYVTAITGRVDEFSDQNSSAFVRFVGPNQALVDLIYPDFVAFLFGRGPGVADQLGSGLDYVSNFPVMHKLLIEYGMFGLMPFMAFAIYRFFAMPRSRVLSGALFIMYLFLSGSLLQPHTIYLCFVLAMLFPKQEGEAEPVALRPREGAAR
jgi:hypothetical protein